MTAHEPDHHRLHMVLACLLLLAFTTATPSLAQVDPQASPAAPTSTPGPTPIPASEIATRAGTIRDLVRDAEAAVAPGDRLIQIQQEFQGEQNRIAALLIQTDELLETQGQVSQIEEAEKAAVRVRERFGRWMQDLSRWSEDAESTLRELQAERQLWELTRDLEREAALPTALKDQVSEAVDLIRAGEEQVRATRDEALALQAGVAQQQSTLDELLVRQRAAIAERSVGIFDVDSPPLWRAFNSIGGDQLDITDQLEAAASRQMQDVRAYVDERGLPLLVWVFLWVWLATTLVVLRDKTKEWVQRDESLTMTAAMLERPLSAAAVVVVTTMNILDQHAPAAWISLVNLLLLLSLVLLLFGLIARELRPAPYLLIVLFTLASLVQLLPNSSPTQRLAMLALSLVGMAGCGWFLRVVRTASGLLPETWLPWAVRGMRLAIALLAAGLLANFAGAVRLAALLVVGTVNAIFSAIILLVVCALLRAMVRIALITPAAHRLGIAPAYSDTVNRVLSRTIALIATIVWIVFILREFTLYGPAFAKLHSVLTAEGSIGEFSISLADVLVFALIVWLSTKLAALVVFVLDVIVLPRVDLPTGVPQTISRVSRYLVILCGIVIAFSAIGVDVSKAALVAGGLGVGVGFGLQNIVNNFVSGLILAFERPIRVGDIIELDDASGVVEKIGMRATLIRTWRGPELIVPNATLISSDVVNWTLKRDRRRAQVPVRVDFDSDPDVVAELLVGVAKDHPLVLKKPAPDCYFLGFGESSLDFELWAWAATDHCFRVQSDLRFAVRRALTDAGIVIPYPQRDVHLRPGASDSPEDGAGESSADTTKDSTGG